MDTALKGKERSQDRILEGPHNIAISKRKEKSPRERGTPEKRLKEKKRFYGQRIIGSPKIIIKQASERDRRCRKTWFFDRKKKNSGEFRSGPKIA